METCALCPNGSHETVLLFRHIRNQEQVDLEVPLCGDCGNRLEKHIKRAIPKRLMRVSPVLRLSGGSGAALARKAA